jgi:hypothetical protein
MPAWNSSSLSFSDGMTRHKGSGLLKNTKERVSKQQIMGHKMFGGKRGKHGEDFKVGSKMFRKKGKDVGKKGAISSTPHGGISPSVEEFDDMLSGDKKKKKTLFNRKSFG